MESVCTLSMLPPTEGRLLARLYLGGVAILLRQFFETVALAEVLAFTRVLCALAGRLARARIHAITPSQCTLASSATAVLIETTLKRRAAVVAIAAPETDLDISIDHFSR